MDSLARNVVFHDSCRDAIFQILQSSARPHNRVLLPAYVGVSHIEGSGVLDPIKKSGSEFHFYPVLENLEPDLSEFTAAMESFHPTHTLLIHYFGWTPRNASRFSQLAASRGVEVVHDLAHSVFSREVLDLRDIGSNHWVFSIHKTCPSRAGGISVSNVRVNQTISIGDLAVFATVDLRQIAKARKANARFLYARLLPRTRRNYSLPFNPYRQEVASPLNLPVVFDTKELRERAYFRLVEKGIYPTALYHRLVPEIGVENFPVSHSIANRILNLPTHQEVTPKDLKEIAQTVRTLR